MSSYRQEIHFLLPHWMSFKITDEKCREYVISKTAGEFANV